MMSEPLSCTSGEVTRHTAVAIRDFHLQYEGSTISPIGRLPLELLRAVFIQRAQDNYEDLLDKVFDPFVPQWVNVSYVCGQWRNVALGCSTLWSYHFVASVRWTEELLARSKQELLKIYIGYNHLCHESWWLDLVEKLMNHAERIQQLCLNLKRADSGETSNVVSKFASYFSNLQNLEMLSSRFLKFPAHFEVDTSTLRVLALSYCYSTPQFLPNLTGLTTLSLEAVGDSLDSMTLLATLGGMQDLRHLYLNDAVASAQEFTTSATFGTLQKKINLPHLSRLFIAAPVSTVVVLLSHMNVPLETEIKLQCQFEDDSPNDTYDLLPSVLVQKLNTAKNSAMSNSLRSLVIKFVGRGLGFTLNTSEHDCDSTLRSIHISHVCWDDISPLQIFIELDDKEKKREFITSKICCTMPLTSVESIHIIGLPSSPAFWRKILERLQGLRSIKLSNRYMQDQTLMLSSTDHKGDLMENVGRSPEACDQLGGQIHTVASALEQLEMYHAAFSRGGWKCCLPHLLFSKHSTRNASQAELLVAIQRAAAEPDKSDSDDDDESDFGEGD